MEGFANTVRVDPNPNGFRHYLSLTEIPVASEPDRGDAISFGPFLLLARQRLLLKVDRPYVLAAALWIF